MKGKGWRHIEMSPNRQAYKGSRGPVSRAMWQLVALERSSKPQSGEPVRTLVDLRTYQQIY